MEKQEKGVVKMKMGTKVSNAKHLKVKKGTVISKLVNNFEKPEKIIAMKVNGLSENLNDTIHGNLSSVSFEPIYLNSIDGESILRRSVCFIMQIAIYELTTGTILKPEDDDEGETKALSDVPPTWFVRHQLDNGYFCCFEDCDPETNPYANEEFFQKLFIRMNEIVKRELPITRKRLYYQDAIDYFEGFLHHKYTVKLLKSLNKYTVHVDNCCGFMNLHHRTLIPNTKFCHNFQILPLRKGWEVRFHFSKWSSFYQPSNMSDERIVKMNQERSEFIQKNLGVACVGDINKLILNNEIEEFISLNNLYQETLLNQIVRRIKAKNEKNGGKCKLILIAGPSAAGKTTFALKLRRNFMCKGFKCVTLSVDDYYKPRIESPIDEETGKYDFERLDALRVDKLNKDLTKLLNGEEIWIPKFNFKTGWPNDEHHKLKLEKNTLLIMEGIHCLNEKLTSEIDINSKYKIFLAPFTPVSLDDMNYISNRTIRLIRRMVRDQLQRGHGIETTMSQWPIVRRGENMFIFPFMKDADFVCNTALDYEICVLKPYVLPILKSVKPDSPYFDTVFELLTFLDKFGTIPYKYVPRDSLLQEFINGHWFN